MRVRVCDSPQRLMTFFLFRSGTELMGWMIEEGVALALAGLLNAGLLNGALLNDALAGAAPGTGPGAEGAVRGRAALAGIEADEAAYVLPAGAKELLRAPPDAGCCFPAACEAAGAAAPPAAAPPGK